MDKELSKITITTEDGRIIEGEILFHFEANGDDFVLYEAQEQVFASKIDENNALYPVEEDEWELIEKIYNEYIADMEKEQ